MFCPYCGKENQDSSNFCTSCGAKLEKPIAKEQDIVFESQNIAPIGQEETKKPAKNAKGAIAGFVLALVGIFCAGLVCGILGLIFSSLALNQIKQNKELKGKGLATAGLVISIIDVIIMIIYYSI